MSLFVPPLTEEETQRLEWISRREPNAIVVRRAIVILASSRGVPLKQIADTLGYNEVQVRRIIHMYINDGIQRLCHELKRGRPATFSEKQRKSVIKIARQSPREFGYSSSQWSLSMLQSVLVDRKVVDYISRPTIRTILRKAKSISSRGDVLFL